LWQRPAHRSIDDRRAKEETLMTASRYRRFATALSFAISLLAASSAWALNDVQERSCDPDCATKPPKQTLFIRSSGDLDGNGASPQITGTLAKGKKKTVIRVDLTYEWFSLSNQFRSLTVKANGKFPINFVILSHITSCGSGSCVVSATYWFDIDQQEAVYPGQFYGLPVTISLEQSAKAADANSTYNATLAIAVVKKK
jgi:hypothetical protein